MPNPTECSVCGANREALVSMLAESPVLVLAYRGWEKDYYKVLESENHALARHIIANCQACKEAFGRHAVDIGSQVETLST